MDQKSFSIFKKPQLPLQIIPFLVITFFSETQSIYWNSTRCEPQHCGNNEDFLIQYPFWIPGRQESYCGSPQTQFITTCIDGYPTLKFSGDDYIILNVNYTENSVVLARPEAFDQNNKCPVPHNNFSVEGTPFIYGPNTADLYFFYNCSNPYRESPYQYRIQCASNNSDYAFAVFHTKILDEFNESCQASVNSPVSSDNINELFGLDYTHVLKMGFVLQWNGSDCRNCNSSGNHCGSDNDSFICFCKDNVGRKSCGGGGLNLGLKIVIGFSAAGGTAIVMCLVFFFYQRNRKKSQAEVALISHHSPSYPSSSVIGNEKSGSLFGVHVFTYNDLEDATSKFDPNNIVGDGGFGTVYKGKLQDGRVIAVKRMYENNFRMVEQFLNEVEMLRRLRHRNLVTLYGCTSRHSRELLLVYEYISNGTVADHLHGPFAKPGSLPWITRMSIATETACALAYLHASDVIHRDVKTNNILLDNNFCVKVADFGLSRLFPTHVTHVSTAPQGTPGYVDPEYHQCYHLTDRSDVFSFGVVLIELISSKPAVDITRHRHEINLSNMAMNKIQNDALHELVDPELGYECDEKVRKTIDAVAELSFRCLQSERDTRPSMEEVSKALQDLQCEDLGIKIEENSKSKQIFSSPDTFRDLASRSTTSSTSS